MSSEDREVDMTIDVLHQAAMQGIDKNMEDWREHPLFINQLPEDIDENPVLGGIQKMMYEGETKDSLALHFKNLGNELYQSGRKNWLAAAKWWTEGLKENPDDVKLKSILHSNRATVSLGLQQYQKAALDADWAIQFDNMNKKAYLRAAHAYQGMSNWDKALFAARAGLEIVEESDSLYPPLSQVVEDVTSQITKNDQRVHTYIDSLTACKSFFRQRNISVGRFAHKWMSNWELALQFDERTEQIIWPMVICYDEVLQLDFVEAFNEEMPIIKLLEMILPGNKGSSAEYAPWDTEKRYKLQKTIVYVKTNEVASEWGRKAKTAPSTNLLIDPECNMKDIFNQLDYVIPGYPILYFAIDESKFAKSLGITQVLHKRGRSSIE